MQQLRAVETANVLTLVREWDRFLEAQGASEKGRKNYRYGVLRFLVETCPEDLAEIEERHVAAFLATLSKHASARTIYARALRSFLSWAARRGHVPTNVAAELTPRTPRSQPPASLADDELCRFIYAAAS